MDRALSEFELEMKQIGRTEGIMECLDLVRVKIIQFKRMKKAATTNTQKMLIINRLAILRDLKDEFEDL